MKLLFLFVGMPIIEMWLLIEVGARIGALPTIGLVLLTATVGLALLRQQGFATLMRANRRMEAGELPAEEVAEGFALAIGGALLLTPGFVTDAIGFACLIPYSRRAMIAALKRNIRFVGMASNDNFYHGGGAHGSGATPGAGDVFDGEFQREGEGSSDPQLPRDDS